MTEPTPTEILLEIRKVGDGVRKLTREQALTRKALVTISTEVARIATRQLEFADDIGRRVLALERKVFPSDHPGGHTNGT